MQAPTPGSSRTTHRRHIFTGLEPVVIALKKDGSLPEVNISSSASFENGLRQFNKLVQQSGILKEARQRQYFEPPSVVRKRKAATKLRKSLKTASSETASGVRYGSARRKPGPAR